MNVSSLLATAALVGALSATACSGPTPMKASAASPFSEGTVDASYKLGGNGSVKVRVKNLGDASKIAKEATIYVVWLTPENGAPQNAGALKVDGDMEGELEFTTSFKKFHITVTPEPSAEAASKSGTPVLEADVVAD
ncbi:MAG: hypothetical protein U0414_36870 [Polyangiaceae bacterium]